MFKDSFMGWKQKIHSIKYNKVILDAEQMFTGHKSMFNFQTIYFPINLALCTLCRVPDFAILLLKRVPSEVFRDLATAALAPLDLQSDRIMN